MLNELYKIHSFYKFSLDSFVIVVNRAIDIVAERMNPKKEIRAEGEGEGEEEEIATELGEEEHEDEDELDLESIIRELEAQIAEEEGEGQGGPMSAPLEKINDLLEQSIAFLKK